MVSVGLASLLFAPATLGLALLSRGRDRLVRVAAWVLLTLVTVWATLLVVTGMELSLGPLLGPLGSELSWRLAGTSASLALLAAWLVVIGLSPLLRPLEDGPPAPAAIACILLSAILSALTVDDLLVRVISLDLALSFVCPAPLLRYRPPPAFLPSGTMRSYCGRPRLSRPGTFASCQRWHLEHRRRATRGRRCPPWNSLGDPGTGLVAAWIKLALPPLGGMAASI